MTNEKADPRAKGRPIEICDNEGLWLEYVTCPFCSGLFGIDQTYLEQVDDHVHCPMCCMEVVITDLAEDKWYCYNCAELFDGSSVYWHNYDVVGYFCDQCFDLVVEHTGSGPKLAEIRKENG